MLRIIARLLTILTIAGFIWSGLPVVTSFAVTTPTPTSSNPLDAACSQTGAAKSELCLNKPDGATDPVSGSGGVIAKALNVILIVAGVAAVIMVMIGGFEYIISSGDSNKISSAKNTILYAVIGLVVALMAEVILKFVIKHV